MNIYIILYIRPLHTGCRECACFSMLGEFPVVVNTFSYSLIIPDYRVLSHIEAIGEFENESEVKRRQLFVKIQVLMTPGSNPLSRIDVVTKFVDIFGMKTVEIHLVLRVACSTTLIFSFSARKCCKHQTRNFF